MTEKLSNPKKTIEVIQKHGFDFQKKFGQNFLIDPHVLDKIIAAAGITKDDFVLEIGPGIGTMTQYLAEAAREVTAVEIDRNLIPILEETLAEYDNVTVINQDILKLDLEALSQEKNGGRPIKVVANLPYYITTPIIMGLYESHVPVKQHHRYGAERSGTADAGRPRQQGLRCAVTGCPVLCLSVHRGKCTAELLHAASKCGKRSNPSGKLSESAGICKR